MVNDQMAAAIVELQDENGAWIEVTRYPWTELGELTPLDQTPHLTSDGLRMTLAARAPGGSFLSHFGYAERTSILERFTTFVSRKLEASSLFTDVNLSDGCDRLYLSQNSGVFFINRE